MNSFTLSQVQAVGFISPSRCILAYTLPVSRHVQEKGVPGNTSSFKLLLLLPIRFEYIPRHGIHEGVGGGGGGGWFHLTCSTGTQALKPTESLIAIDRYPIIISPNSLNVMELLGA